MLAKSRSAKAAAAAAAVLLSAFSAAAAGALPGAAQSAASDALDKVGVSVPGPDDRSDGHADVRGKSADHDSSSDATEATDGAPEATTPDTGPNDHARFGLCTAREASGGRAYNHADPFPFDCDDLSHPGQPDESRGKPADPGSQGRTHKPSSTPEDPSATAPAEQAADASATGATASSAGAGNRGNRGRP